MAEGFLNTDSVRHEAGKSTAEALQSVWRLLGDISARLERLEGTLSTALPLHERSVDPPDPREGNMVAWLSDGTGSGSDGDLMVKTNVGGVLTTYTLSGSAGSDHGGLGGLSDDDHTQYYLTDGSRTADLLFLGELSADPSDPASGEARMWVSDGTGSGRDGDLMIKLNTGAGVTIGTFILATPS